jgi:hypothetical protein
VIGFLAGGAAGDWFLKRKGLKKGRRSTGMLGLGTCGFLLLMAAVSPDNILTAGCLIGANFAFSFGVMVSYAVCADIGRNNAGTVTGAMNFFGQMVHFSCPYFWKDCSVTHHFDCPLCCGIRAFYRMPALAIDPEKSLPSIETNI